MDTATATRFYEPRWWLYLLAFAFVSPGLAAWGFAIRYLYPKVQVIWKEGGAVGSEAQWIMNAVARLVEYGGPAFVALVITLMLVELRSTAWANHRRVVVGSAVVLLNSVVLVGLTTMCILALFAAPGLRAA